jgi:hypothetical protein
MVTIHVLGGGRMLLNSCLLLLLRGSSSCFGSSQPLFKSPKHL